MRHSARAQGYGDGTALESYVMGAIVSARESYHEPKWLFWADNWINGRDRSYESADRARRQARKASEWRLAGEGPLGACDEMLESFSDELPAERAAWAAGLALVTAPMGPDLTGSCLRFEAALKRGIARLLASLAWLPAADRWAGLMRYLGAVS